MRLIKHGKKPTSSLNQLNRTKELILLKHHMIENIFWIRIKYQ